MTAISPKYKILFVAAEVAPFASVGGLSQVMYFLPRALKKLGHDVAVFLPKYGTLDERKYRIKPLIKGLRVPTGELHGAKELICNIKVRIGTKKEPTIYFLENMEYYEKRANVYGYSDDPTRFALLSRGALEFLRQSTWIPDVIHNNDWHSGYLPNYLRTTYRDDRKLSSCATLLTIHNLANQGVVDFRYASPLEFDDGKSELASLFSPHLCRQNGLKRGIIYSDIVNTVSERYSREMMTPKYGEGLDQLLKEVRAKVYGVLNGLDYDDFNPATDTFIKKNFSISAVSDRVVNKLELQKEFNLPLDPEIPILAMSGRLSEQKGFDLIEKILPYLLKEFRLQFIVMGFGDYRFREYFTKLEAEYPKQVGTHLMANWQLPRKIYAGADLFLLPSRFEPGGIVIIEAMRYGAVPLVRSTGGLVDTVIDFDIQKNSGNGFVFHQYSDLAFFGALSRALEIYKAKRIWNGILKRAMNADFSWETSAVKYVDLYERAIKYRAEAVSENPSPAFRGLVS
jgi:starch synthase